MDEKRVEGGNAWPPRQWVLGEMVATNGGQLDIRQGPHRQLYPLSVVRFHPRLYHLQCWVMVCLNHDFDFRHHLWIMIPCEEDLDVLIRHDTEDFQRRTFVGHKSMGERYPPRSAPRLSLSTNIIEGRCFQAVLPTTFNDLSGWIRSFQSSRAVRIGSAYAG